MKIKFFSRVTAVALTLAMLIPCLTATPVFADEAAASDPAVTNLYHFGEIKHDPATRTKVLNTMLSPNVGYDYDSKTTGYNYPVQYARISNLYTPEGIKTLKGYTIAGTTWPTTSAGSRAQYSVFNGVPYRINNGNVQVLENLKIDLIGETFPIITRGMGAMNLSFTYGGGNGVMDPITANELRVFVSLDGETYLPEGVGIRNWKLVGGGQRDLGNRGKANQVVFHVETEDLFTIPGVEPGTRINGIRLQLLDDDTSNGYTPSLYELDVQSYATKDDFERLVPKRERRYLHVGEETMRQIVADEGARFANVRWHTDTVVHTITGQNNMKHMPGIEYRGAVYTQNGDSNRETLQSRVKDGWYVGPLGQDNAVGTDCQNFVFNCVSRVSTAMGWACQYTMGAPGLELLGKDFLNIPEPIIAYTDLNCVDVNTKQDIFKSYALAKMGDQLVTYASTGGSHVRVVVENHTVYNADGTINGAESYFMNTEQAMYPGYEIQLADGTRYHLSANGSGGYEKLLNYLEEHPGAKVLYGHASQTGIAPDSRKQTYNSHYTSDYIIYTHKIYPTGNIELQDVEIMILPKSDTEPIQDAGAAFVFASNYVWVQRDVVLEDLSTGEKLYESYYVYEGSNDQARGYFTIDELDAVMKGLSNGSYRLSLSVHSGPLTAIGQSQVPITTETYDFTITDRAPAAKVSLNAPASASKGQTVDVLVNTATAADGADLTVKYDPALLTLKSVEQNANAMTKKSTGMVAIMGAGMGVEANGQIAKLTFTANADVAKLADAVELKNASVVTAADANTANAVKALDVTEACAAINFGDVSKTAWYHDAVDYVLENNVMSGFGGGRFGPDEKLNRAMVVQVLYNYEGTPAEATANKFPDIKAEDWYFNATRWGAAKGVVSGYGDGRFGPNDNVTVEQIAVILHNYSGKPAGSGDLSGVGKYDDWAAGALQWAVGAGVLKNVPFTNATETANRAQTAQMLTNFLSTK